MKIYAISDRKPANGLYDRIMDYRPDVILTLGDLSYFDLQDLARINDIPKLGVYGNHCTRGYMNELGIVDVHLKTLVIQGVSFAGFEGCVRYKESQYAPMYTQSEAEEMMINFPKVDIFISHCPPFGVNDSPEDISHQGFYALKDYLITQKPQYWFHGHTYPVVPVTYTSSTNIEYVYRERFLEINIK